MSSSAIAVMARLVGTGLVMGIVHVLTGPDHLSAIATLSSNVDDPWQSFGCGVRWGIGHSIGVIVVGTFFIVLDSYNQGNGDEEEAAVDVPESFENVLEYMVGICMLGLGIYGIFAAFRSKNETNDDALLSENFKAAAEKNSSISTPTVEMTDYVNADQEWNDEERGNEHQHHHHHHHHHHVDTMVSKLPSCCRKPSKKVLSIGIGIVHGVAGPGGILGVIPAVQLHNWKLATIYLGSFAIASTLAMGIFASLYGWVSSRVSNGQAVLEFRINVFSACLSILVGILWLVLLSLGILHDIFP